MTRQLNAFEQRLLDDLLELHPQMTARARRRRTVKRATAIVAAAAAIVAAPVVVDVLDPTYDPSHGVLAIAEAEGGVVVSVEDVMAGEAQMNRQLAEAGIPATVKTFPVSPYLVGRFISVEAHGPRGQEVAMQAGRATEVFVPNGVERGLILHVGRPPEPGEDVTAAVTPFHPREIFSCDADLLGADPATIEKALRARGVTDLEWALIHDGVSTEYGPERPDVGHFQGTHAVPGDTHAQVVINTDPKAVMQTLPPECP